MKRSFLTLTILFMLAAGMLAGVSHFIARMMFEGSAA
jgi:hypothetical protein